MISNKTQKYSIEIPSDNAFLNEVEKLSVKVARKAKLNESDSDDLGIVTTELVNNAIHHGNKDNPKKKVKIIYTIHSTHIKLIIRDQGNGFNLEDVGDPLSPDNLLKESGRGIFLIRSMMDSLEFNFTEKGAEVIVTKKIK